MKRIITRSIASVVGAGLAVTLLPSASFAAVSDEGIDSLLSKIAPETRQNLGQTSLVQRSATPEVEIPTSPNDPIVVTGDDGAQIAIELPDATSAGQTLIADVPVTTFDGGNKSTSVPLPKTDGSVQILTVLEDESAPTNYTYDLGLDDGVVMREVEGGFIEIVDQNGEFVAGIAPAWAKDSNGASVPTRYVIEGSTLTQVVDHTSGNFAYPIVADPWLGKDLYNTPYVSFVSKGYKINVTPTPWGVAMASPVTWWAHRDEVKTKLKGNAWRWTNTIQEQFYCHIAGLPLSLPQYNMESWRPLVNWAQSLAQYRCNPYDGKWS